MSDQELPGMWEASDLEGPDVVRPASELSHEEWLARFKGPYRDTLGLVWECGDDECGCTQAQVVERYTNLADSRFVVLIGVWEGTFFTEHEPGAEAELIAYRATLTPERVAQIDWRIE